MLKVLKLEPVEIDGCAVGVRSKFGEPILKPWRIAVSSQHMMQALDGLRCQGGHEHIPCAGSETARSAFYPEQLCNAIHDGLDAHEAAQDEPNPGTHVKPFEALVPGCMSVPGAPGTHVRPFEALVPGRMSVSGGSLRVAGSSIGAVCSDNIDTCSYGSGACGRSAGARLPASAGGCRPRPAAPAPSGAPQSAREKNSHGRTRPRLQTSPAS